MAAFDIAEIRWTGQPRRLRLHRSGELAGFLFDFLIRRLAEVLHLFRGGIL